MVEIHDRGYCTLDDLDFVCEYIRCGNACEAVRRVFDPEGKLKKRAVDRRAYVLLKRKSILDKIEQFRKDYFDKYGESIGDEIISRARTSDDSVAHKYYKQAADIMGLEAPKKSETKKTETFELPSHDAPQIEGEVGEVEADVEFVDAEEVKKLEGKEDV